MRFEVAGEEASCDSREGRFLNFLFVTTCVRWGLDVAEAVLFTPDDWKGADVFTQRNKSGLLREFQISAPRRRTDHLFPEFVLRSRFLVGAPGILSVTELMKSPEALPRWGF